MGYPTPSKKVSTCVKFGKNVTANPKIPDSLISEAHRFAYERVRELKGFCNDLHASWSSAACLEKSNGAGGRIAYGAEIIANLSIGIFSLDSSVEQWYGPTGRPSISRDLLQVYFSDKGGVFNGSTNDLISLIGESEVLVNFSFHNEASRSDAVFEITGGEGVQIDDDFTLYVDPPRIRAKKVGFPSMRLDAVDDDGAKARVVGVMRFGWITVCHLLRRSLVGYLERDPQVPSMNALLRSKDVPKLIGSEPPFDGTDMQTATDDSVIELNRSLAKGAVAAMRFSEDWMARLAASLPDIVVRPYWVMKPTWWPKGERSMTFPFLATVGIPMGMPTSWTLLNLENEFAMHRAGGIGKDLFCGDDHTSCGHPVKKLLLYRENLREQNHKMSQGTDVISERCLTYTENLWVIDEAGKLRKVSAPRIKSLVSKNPPTRSVKFRQVDMLTTVSSRGGAASMTMSQCCLPFSEPSHFKLVLKSANLFSLSANAQGIRMMKDAGIPIYLPRELGGAGFPHPSGFPLRHVPPRILQAVAHLLRNDRSAEAMRSSWTVTRVWNVPTEGASKEAFEYAKALLESALRDERKMRRLEPITESFAGKIWCDVETVSVNQVHFQWDWFSETKFTPIFGRSVEKGDWDSYDHVKALLKASTGYQWIPMATAMENLMAEETQKLLFRCPETKSDPPSIFTVGRRISRIFKALHDDMENRNFRKYDLSRLREKSVADLSDLMKWKKNMVLLSRSWDPIRSIRSKW